MEPGRLVQRPGRATAARSLQPCGRAACASSPRWPAGWRNARANAGPTGCMTRRERASRSSGTRRAARMSITLWTVSHGREMSQLAGALASRRRAGAARDAGVASWTRSPTRRGWWCARGRARKPARMSLEKTAEAVAGHLRNRLGCRAQQIVIAEPFMSYVVHDAVAAAGQAGPAARSVPPLVGSSWSNGYDTIGECWGLGHACPRLELYAHARHDLLHPGRYPGRAGLYHRPHRPATRTARLGQGQRAHAARIDFGGGRRRVGDDQFAGTDHRRARRPGAERVGSRAPRAIRGLRRRLMA